MRAWFWTIFATSLFICGTLFMAKEYLQVQWAFVTYRNYPNGPGAFLMYVGDIEPRPFDFANPVALTITALSDGMLVRCGAYADGFR
jgi:hypothetical protein